MMRYLDRLSESLLEVSAGEPVITPVSHGYPLREEPHQDFTQEVEYQPEVPDPTSDRSQEDRYGVAFYSQAITKTELLNPNHVVELPEVRHVKPEQTLSPVRPLFDQNLLNANTSQTLHPTSKRLQESNEDENVENEQKVESYRTPFPALPEATTLHSKTRQEQRAAPPPEAEEKRVEPETIEVVAAPNSLDREALWQEWFEKVKLWAAEPAEKPVEAQRQTEERKEAYFPPISQESVSRESYEIHIGTMDIQVESPGSLVAPSKPHSEYSSNSHFQTSSSADPYSSQINSHHRWDQRVSQSQVHRWGTVSSRLRRRYI